MVQMADRAKFIVKLIRATEWWEYKLPLMLAVAYATAFLSGAAVAAVAWPILFYVFATAVSYIYVSLINDFTDMEEDQAVGKKTGMLALAPPTRIFALVVSVVLGVVLGWLMWPDALSIAFFAGTWIVFTLYSVRPFRWKARGILGVWCDASGVHLFPTLLMISGVSTATGIPINYGWLLIAGLWSFAYGLRGILWHQFLDKPNDVQTDTNTFVSKLDGTRSRYIIALVVAVELTSFVLMLVYIAQPWLLVLAPIYAGLVYIRAKMLHRKPIFVIAPHHRPWQMIMLDFYQFFLPVGLLIFAAVMQPWAWVVLVLHVLIFPRTGLYAVKDYQLGVKSAGRRLLASVRRIAS